MQIRVGYELIYDCPQPTPMILTLNIHYTRASDIVVPDHLTTDPPVPLAAYRDLFAIGARGSWRRRAASGSPPRRSSGYRPARRDRLVGAAARRQDLPEETLIFLLGSRYCDTDRLSQTAWDLFDKFPTGWARVQAICDFVHNHIKFGYEYASATRSASEAFNERRGVCRDYAHLAVAFCAA